MDTESARILSVEDESTVRRSIVTYLEDSGFEMLEAENGRIALEVFEREHPDLVLCDLRMPEVDGLRVLEKLSIDYPETPIIIVSGTGDMRDAVEALKLGAWDYIMKPIQDMMTLEHAVRKCLERARLIRENREFREHLVETNRALEESLHQLEEDESAARRIQFQLLPPARGEVLGVQFSRMLKTSALLSGDFVDYFQIDESRVGFYIADVSGHGVSSAFVTVLLKTTMNALLEQYRQAENDTVLYPDRVLKSLNDDIYTQDFDKYLTMFYAVLDLGEKTLSYSNGGHFPYPLLNQEGGEPEFVGEKNLPVGLFSHAEFKTETMTIPDRFVMGLFSDGVFELFPRESLDERLLILQNEMSHFDVDLESLYEGLGLETVDTPPDDITMLLVRKEG